MLDRGVSASTGKMRRGSFILRILPEEVVNDWSYHVVW